MCRTKDSSSHFSRYLPSFKTFRSLLGFLLTIICRQIGLNQDNNNPLDMTLNCLFPNNTTNRHPAIQVAKVKEEDADKWAGKKATWFGPGRTQWRTVLCHSFKNQPRRTSWSICGKSISDFISALLCRSITTWRRCLTCLNLRSDNNRFKSTKWHLVKCNQTRCNSRRPWEPIRWLLSPPRSLVTKDSYCPLSLQTMEVMS